MVLSSVRKIASWLHLPNCYLNARHSTLLNFSFRRTLYFFEENCRVKLQFKYVWRGDRGSIKVMSSFSIIRHFWKEWHFNFKRLDEKLLRLAIFDVNFFKYNFKYYISYLFNMYSEYNFYNKFSLQLYNKN